jgi:hypothetical protein
MGGLIPRVAGLALVAGVSFGGCTCEARHDPTPALPAAAATANAAAEEPASDPAGPPVTGFFCPGRGEVADASPGDYRAGPWAVRKLPHWQDPPDESARFINVPGVRDVARSADQAFMVRRRLPTDHYMVLTAKVHEFPPGTTFDEQGRRHAFDDVGASPHALLYGTRAITWAGRPAVEGTVAAVYPAGPKVVVHHLILPFEDAKAEAKAGPKALVVTYLGTEDHFHRFFAEACDAAVAVK